MAEAICDTSPLYFLHQAGVLHWLEALFGGIWVPRSVAAELEEGGRRGHRVPSLADLNWVQLEDPVSIPADAGLELWGPLRVLLEAKERGLTASVRPVLETLVARGMWISADLQGMILALAGEGQVESG